MREGCVGDDPSPAQLGRYLIRSILGTGAFGTVYLARDPKLNRDVAIKVSRVRETSAREDNNALALRERVRVRVDAIAAEARHAASLNHPGIVSIFDVGHDDDRPYIVMEYVTGKTLEDLLDFQRPKVVQVAELLASVADALHYAHQRGFVHRDLKPANILLDESVGNGLRAVPPYSRHHAPRDVSPPTDPATNTLRGVPDIGLPKIADFGLAVTDDTQRTLAGQIAGTPAYMSPEQVRGAAHHLDGRTDIWSLGVIGYQLLTGRQPFWHGDALACLDAIQHRDPKPPRQIDDTIPAELERIILKCLAKQPTDRYATAGDLAADLRRWLRIQAGGNKIGRRALIAAAFVAAISLTIIAWRSTSAPNSPSAKPLTGTIDVRLWNPDDPARRGLSLDEPGALPLRIGDQVRLEASVSEPSYVYIVWIGADGTAHPVYPWRNGDWRDRPAEKPISRVSLPGDPTLGWPMSGPAGTETLLLLARRSPLDRDTDLLELLRGLPDILIDDPRAFVRLDEGKVAHTSDRAPQFSSPQAIDDPALAAQRFLKERLHGRFDTVRAVSFAVASQE